VLSAAGDALTNFVWAYAGWIVKSKVSRPMKTAEIFLFWCDLILMPAG
jgi:hypothetical protein